MEEEITGYTYYETKCYYDIETDEHIAEYEAGETREGEQLVEELMVTLGEGKLISGLEWNEDAKKILLDELLNEQKIW